MGPPYIYIYIYDISTLRFNAYSIQNKPVVTFNYKVFF